MSVRSHLARLTGCLLWAAVALLLLQHAPLPFLWIALTGSIALVLLARTSPGRATRIVAWNGALVLAACAVLEGTLTLGGGGTAHAADVAYPDGMIERGGPVRYAPRAGAWPVQVTGPEEAHSTFLATLDAQGRRVDPGAAAGAGAANVAFLG